jgi:hypothetical protein
VVYTKEFSRNSKKTVAKGIFGDIMDSTMARFNTFNFRPTASLALLLLRL